MSENCGPSFHVNEFVLSRFAPYRIVAMGHELSRCLSRAYAGEGLTIPEWRVLATISQADAIAARDVVANTPMDKMAVSRATTSLEVKGLVCRVTDPKDRRVSSLSLSVSGRAVFERVAVLALSFEKKLLSALSLEERESFDKLLAKLERATYTVAPESGVLDFATEVNKE